MKSVVENIQRVNRGYLRGHIAEFPLAVVQKMCEYQVNQGNKFDPTVFQNETGTNVGKGGFCWRDTPEGHDFWFRVIHDKKFNLFFKEFNK